MRNLGFKLLKVAAIIVSIIVGGLLLYYIYLGIGCRTYEMFDILKELNHKSPDIIRMSSDWEKILKRKGESMGIDLYNEVKQVLLATE